MCIFTSEVEQVSGTRIFARATGDRQCIVYSMAYAAKSTLAMVLPIPIVPGSPDHAVHFIDLSACPYFFDFLAAGFPSPTPGEGLEFLGLEEPTAVLEVHDVGSYEATFVPRPQDFGRLDPRFRLPVDIWLELANYRDWGFVVFKLKETRLAQAHPMGFDFPRRDRKCLFFPTLHLHHGRLEKEAAFDHVLYLQPEPALNWHLHEWEDTRDPVSAFVRDPEALRLLDPDYPCWRAEIRSVRENRDVWVGQGETMPRHIRW